MATDEADAEKELKYWIWAMQMVQRTFIEWWEL